MSNHPFLRRVATLLAVSLVLSVPLQAQTAANDWSRLNSVESDSKLSVQLKSGKSIEGRLVSVSDSTLSLKVKNKTQEIKREEVQTVHRVVGKSVLTPTLLGMGIGAGVGAAIGGIGADGSEFDKLDQAVVAGMAVIGAVIGTVAGYFIGRSRTKKILIYEAR
jgi:small nuclear ribonucleoprotein (snRNP)-like protein